MKIIINTATIDMDLYDHYIYQPDFMAICFVVKKEIADWGMQVPLIFRSREATKEAFCRLNAGRSNSAYSVSLSDIDCRWTKELGERVTEYANHMKDFNRPL